jgi:hypothetical protein
VEFAATGHTADLRACFLPDCIKHVHHHTRSRILIFCVCGLLWLSICRHTGASQTPDLSRRHFSGGSGGGGWQAHHPTRLTQSARRAPPTPQSVLPPRELERSWTTIDRSAADAWHLPHSAPYAPGRLSAVAESSGPRRPPFSVVSYNILAHEFAEPHLYRHCPRWALDRHFRAGRILTELIEAAADIVRRTELTRFLRHEFISTRFHESISNQPT